MIWYIFAEVVSGLIGYYYDNFEVIPSQNLLIIVKAYSESEGSGRQVTTV